MSQPFTLPVGLEADRVGALELLETQKELSGAEQRETPAEKVKEDALSGESEFSAGAGIGPYSEGVTPSEPAAASYENMAPMEDSGSKNAIANGISTNPEEAHRDDDKSVNKASSVTTANTGNDADDNASMIPLGKGSYTAPPMGLDTGANSATGTGAVTSADVETSRGSEDISAGKTSTHDQEDDVGRSEVERVLAGGLGAGAVAGLASKHGTNDQDKTIDNVQDHSSNVDSAKEVTPVISTSNEVSHQPNPGATYGTASEATEAALARAGLADTNEDSSANQNKIASAPISATGSSTGKDHGSAVPATDDEPSDGQHDTVAAIATPGDKGKGRAVDDEIEPALASPSSPRSPSSGGDKLFDKLKREVEERARKGQLGQFNKPSGTAIAPSNVGTSGSKGLGENTEAGPANSSNTGLSQPNSPATKNAPATPSAFKEEFEPSETGLEPVAPAATTANRPPSTRNRAGSVSSQTSAAGKSGGFMGGLFRRRSKRQSISDGTTNNRKASNDLGKTVSREQTANTASKDSSVPLGTAAIAGAGAVTALGVDDKRSSAAEKAETHDKDATKAVDDTAVVPVVGAGDAKDTETPVADASVPIADTKADEEDKKVDNIPYETTTTAQDADIDDDKATTHEPPTTEAIAASEPEPEYIAEVPAPSAAASDLQPAPVATGTGPETVVEEDKKDDIPTAVEPETATEPSTTHDTSAPLEIVPDVTAPAAVTGEAKEADHGGLQSEPFESSKDIEEPVATSEVPESAARDTDAEPASELKSSTSQGKELGIAAILAERVRTNSMSNSSPTAIAAPKAVKEAETPASETEDNKKYPSDLSAGASSRGDSASLQRSNSKSKGGLLGLFRRKSSRRGSTEVQRSTSDIGAPKPIAQEKEHDSTTTTVPTTTEESDVSRGVDSTGSKIDVPSAGDEQPKLLVLNEAPTSTDHADADEGVDKTHTVTDGEHDLPDNDVTHDSILPSELETVEEEHERGPDDAATEPDRSASLYLAPTRSRGVDADVVAADDSRVTPAASEAGTERDRHDGLVSAIPSATHHDEDVQQPTAQSPRNSGFASSTPKEEKRKSKGGFFGLFRSRTQKERPPSYTPNTAVTGQPGLIAHKSPTTKEVAVGTEDDMPISPVSGGFTEDDDAHSYDGYGGEAVLEEEVPDNRSITEIAASTPLPKPVYTDKTQAKHDRIRKKREEAERIERERIRHETDLLNKRERIMNAYTGKQDFSNVPKPVRNKGFGRSHDRKDLDGIQFVNKSAKTALKQEEAGLTRTTSRGSSIEEEKTTHPASGGLVGSIPLNKNTSRQSTATAPKTSAVEPSSPTLASPPASPSSPRKRKVSKRLSSGTTKKDAKKEEAVNAVA